MKKKILGLDLGTNSIGWALIESDFDSKEGDIIGVGSRIIPMDQGILGDFDKGNSVSQTAERTGYRGVRRLRQRSLLRRERLNRVLNVLNFLPEYYKKNIDFKNKKGQFVDGKEVRLPYKEDNKFIFEDSYNEMLADFRKNQPEIFKEEKKVPYDWTIYYLRKKALERAVTKEELAWIILNFNQKRGYYQLRGEEEEETKGKTVEFHSLKVVECVDTGEKNKKKQSLYSILLENGMKFIKPSNIPVDWEGKTKDLIITTDINDDGSVKIDKYGEEKRSFRVPKDDDWTLVKKRTEHDIEVSRKTVGCYIYDAILANPSQKIKGKLVRTIERANYKEELIQILESQKEFHSEFRDKEIYRACLMELYPNNEMHRANIELRDLAWFFVNDIIFYQRPLKSKKSLIAGCRYESRVYKKEGEYIKEPVKCVDRSHPVFQEFRLWQFVRNLRVLQREGTVDGKHKSDIDVTADFICTEDKWVKIFDNFNSRKEVGQKAFLKIFDLKEDKYRWNYVEDKKYPCNETKTAFVSRLKKIEGVDVEAFLTEKNEEDLWHILYSINDREELKKALTTFGNKHDLSIDFVDAFIKFPPFKNDYAAYSLKAIKKLLPLMRMGKYWNESAINDVVKERIDKILTGEYDEKIRDRVREKAISLTEISMFKGLPLWLVCYIVYDRHSEDGDIVKWNVPVDIEMLTQNSLRNPIVEQIINETLQVVKDIWQYYGKGKENFFDEIHVELGREMKNPSAIRKSMSEKNQENENTNIRVKALLRELKDEGINEVRPFSPSQQEILKIYEEGVYFNDDSLPDDIVKIRKNTNPTSSEIKRYKLWLEQGYISPYTGKLIPLSDLFTTKYQIEHIIPQARYFDDSMSNKIVCESAVNGFKSSKTAYEMILKHPGEVIDLGEGRNVALLSKDAYESHIKKYFSKNKTKRDKLLSEDVPEGFINRQLNDSRYISKVVKGLLSNVVREKDEQEATSKNIVTLAGSITSRLKQDWGLNDVWNSIITPRFVRLNEMCTDNNKGVLKDLDGTSFGQFKNENGNRYFQISVPDEVGRGFSKKRIDHRHHTLDALIIACTTKDHVSYITSLNTESKSYLAKKLRIREKVKTCDGREIMAAKKYYKPWDSFTQDVRESLLGVVVSFKKNTRVINKTKNYYEKWQADRNGDLKKIRVEQIKGENWAIRKPLHKETVYGKVNLQMVKTISLAKALENWESIKDRALRNKVKSLFETGCDVKKVRKYFKEQDNVFNGKEIKNVEVFYYDNGNVASRVILDDSFNSKKIETITDKGIQKVLIEHLKKYNMVEGKGAVKEHPELAFAQDGLDVLNAELKGHKPIHKVRTYEPMGKKFRVGLTGNSKDKFVEAAKGTNLFFGIYGNEKGIRTYDSIPFNMVIERQKQGLISVPETDAKGNNLLFFLCPNDLVYVPTEEEMDNPNIVDFSNMDKEQVARVYKMVSASGNQCFFVGNNISISIINKVEFSPLNKMEKDIYGVMIKQVCWKLKVDRLGNIIGVER